MKSVLLCGALFLSSSVSAFSPQASSSSRQHVIPTHNMVYGTYDGKGVNVRYVRWSPFLSQTILCCFHFISHQYNQIDPEAMYHVATNAGDAVRLVFLECNGNECHIVDGWKDGNYWQFEGRPSTFPDTAAGGYNSHRLEVLMAEMDTTE